MTPPLMSTGYAGVDYEHFLFSTNLPCDKHHSISIEVFGFAFGALYLGLHVITIPRRHYIRPLGLHQYPSIEIHRTY